MCWARVGSSRALSNRFWYVRRISAVGWDIVNYFSLSMWVIVHVRRIERIALSGSRSILRGNMGGFVGIGVQFQLVGSSGGIFSLYLGLYVSAVQRV